MSDKLVWIDGSVLPTSTFHLDPEDEGLLYGRGVFTTTRTFRSRPWLWSLHYRRLLASCESLGIRLDETSLPTATDITEFVEQIGQGDVVIRVNISAGSAALRPRIWTIWRPLPQRPVAARLTIHSHPIGIEPLSGLKSFSYLTRHLAYQAARSRGFDDAILVGPSNQVLETAHSNLFAYSSGRWITPPATLGVLNGTVRQTLLAKNIGIAEDSITESELRRAEELVLSNSVLGVVAVREVDGQVYPTTELSERLQSVVESTQS